MGTNIGPGASTGMLYGRAVFRDSSDNIIALVPDTLNTDLLAYISTDGGSTWNGGNAVAPDLFASTPVFGGTEIDGSDVFHTATVSQSDNSQTLYNQWTIATNGNVTKNVTDELVFDSATNFQDRAVDGADIALDSSGTVFVVAGWEDRIMGTFYTHNQLLERTGTATYTDHGSITTGETWNKQATICTDSVGDVHIIWSTGVSSASIDGTAYDKFDVSAGTFDGNETVDSNEGHNGVMVDGSDVPLTVSGDLLYKRTGGTWSSDAYTTDTAADILATLAFGGTDVYVMHTTTSGTDLDENHNVFGSFATGDETNLESGTDDLDHVRARWQPHNNNSPTPDVVDIIYWDSTNDNVVYTSISLSGAQTLELSEVVQVQKN